MVTSAYNFVFVTGASAVGELTSNLLEGLISSLFKTSFFIEFHPSTGAERTRAETHKTRADTQNARYVIESSLVGASPDTIKNFQLEASLSEILIYFQILKNKHNTREHCQIAFV